MTNSFNYIACSSFSFSANHGCSFAYSSQGLPKIATTTDKRNLELVFVDVMGFICRSENFAFIDIIDAERFQYLGFNKVTNSCFRHHWNRNSSFDSLNNSRIAHPGNAPMFSNVSWDSLQSHHCNSTSFFSNLCFVGIYYIHNYASFEHLSEPNFQCKCPLLRGFGRKFLDDAIAVHLSDYSLMEYQEKSGTQTRCRITTGL
mmetsp:Transcript_10566/g.18512  ORF Transcript_10566/g.18512 Transcript_10566/m.18512 type:complete len:202 (-) Transcript_10566:44-649(-)